MKPNHEIGASRLLSFAKPAAPVKTAPKADVWTLEDIEDDTVELMDDSELLNEEDLVKPDPASLRVCGTTGEQGPGETADNINVTLHMIMICLNS